MQQATLHYFYDPFCGWCYAAAPMVSAAQDVPSLRFRPMAWACCQAMPRGG
ncbi:hypothetical protein [Pseudomonas putida]|uniref:hypothetical protein n=1 Tax=Pseudomonas putida TaxID=303 RepID=UPI003D06DC9A